MNAARAATIEVRRGKRNYEIKLAMNINLILTENPPTLMYVYSRSRTRKTVGTLVNDNGDTVAVPHKLPDKFYHYFCICIYSRGSGYSQSFLS